MLAVNLEKLLQTFPSPQQLQMVHGSLAPNPNNNGMTNFLLTSVGPSWFGFGVALFFICGINDDSKLFAFACFLSF